MADLRAQPLTAEGQFNWVFLIEVLFTGILALFFLFYFNRLFATLVSYAIRAYTWRTYKAYIDISALQISLLGGRIFFKSIRYHAHNVTVYVYEGHITWRYWLRSVQEAELFQEEDAPRSRKRRGSSVSGTEKESLNDSDEKSRARAGSIGNEEQASAKPKKELPCRIAVKVSGVEAFIYNRSPLYDGIVEATLGKSKDVFGKSGDHDKDGASWSSSPRASSSEPAENVLKTQTRTTTASTASPEKPEIPSFLRIFPIKVECKRAAAAIGNENTTNVLVAKAEKSTGTVDAGRAGPLDLWKLLFNFGIENVGVTMKPNRDFKEFQLDAARRILREKEYEERHQPDVVIVKVAHQAQGFWSRLRLLFRRSQSSADSIRTASMQSEDAKPRKPLLDQLPGPGQWHGLMRYLDDDNDGDEHDEWRKIEYAKASQLVECDKVTMRFYWDMSGPVPEGIADSRKSQDLDFSDDINGAAPPEYGMDLGVHGGSVVYGPWADRQRLNLQSVFFPAPSVDAVPAIPLKPGELRVCTVFKIAVTVEEDVVIRIPAREESKDSRWKGRAENAAKPPGDQENVAGKGETRRWGRHGKRKKGKQSAAAIGARPYAWLDITVKKDSVVNYVMDMFARPTGYRNSLDLDVKGLEMSSSVNHGLLWRSGPLTLDADISQPISWNTIRKWPFNIVVNDLELFILRDHLFLIIDLVNDWASGAPSDFYTFVPYNYQINLIFKNFIMYLNVNDANIINDPADFDKNDFLTLEGQISANLGIPMEHYRPKRNGITFDVLGEDMRMRMISPPKSTFSAFVQDKTMAELPKLTLKGSHNANQESRVGNVDVLRMDIVGSGLSLKAHGFFVRQLVGLKENYFGDYMHFKTLEEFQGASDNLEEANAKTASFPKPTSTNELDVILCIVAEEAAIMLPTNLYSCEEYVRIELPRADVDLRIASYYLDLGLQLSPLSFLSGASAAENEDDEASNTQFFVAHVELNGHRAFGLPPNEDAYVSQWNIDIGKVSGEMSSAFFRDLALAGRALAFCISDDENALPVSSPAVALDTSFVQVRTDTVRLWLHVGRDALLLATEPITVETNDWASETLSQRVNVLVPRITIACVDGRSASRHRIGKHRKQPVKTYAFFQTGLSLDVVGRKLQFDLETQKQQSHIRLHDQRTNRFPFLLKSSIDAPIEEEDDLPFEPPAMPFPPMPAPLMAARFGTGRATSVRSTRSFPNGKRLSSKSSASSLSASLRHSLRPAAKHPGLLSRTSEQSTGGTSASFHSVRGSSGSRSLSRGPLASDAERGRFGLPTSTVTFASSYSEPYFPLDMIEPDETNVPNFPSASEHDSESSDTSSTTAVISNPDIEKECEYSSIMIKVIPGIRAYIAPRVAVAASRLVREVLPHNPDEVMDAFQMGVMGTIQGHNAERHGVKTILEIQAELPAAHVRVSLLDDKEEDVTDQLDLKLNSLATSVRIKTQPADTGPTQCLAFHTLLSRLNLSLVERHSLAAATPAIQFSADDALVWLALSSTNAFHASTRSTTLAVAGDQARYLTALALRLVPVVNDIRMKFKGIFDLNLRRLQYLAHVLTQHGEQTSDPAFMARMVYILRAFPLHFRNTDSWKILARFRFILHNLSKEARDGLQKAFKDPPNSRSEDASIKHVKEWIQWRNWDVPNVHQSVAFKMLSEPDEAKDLEIPEAKPTTITFRAEMLKVGVEHSEGSSDIVFEDLSLGAENSPPTKPEGLLLVDENKREQTILQMNTSTVAFSLDWALTRVAEDVLSFNEQFQQLAASMEPSQSRTASQAFEDGLSRHDIQVVLSTDTGSISLRTTNLRHVSRAGGLKLSLLATTQGSELYGQCVSAILHFDTAVTELYGPSTRIWQTLVSSPSVYLDHLQAAKGVDMPPTVTLAIAYEELQLVVNEQIPGILHTIETVVAEEVAQVQRLVLSLSSPAPTRPPTRTNTNASGMTTASSAPKLHIGLLAGNLRFEISLLQALSYRLDGTAASFRLAPSLSHDNHFSMDFDIGRQNHALVNSSGTDRHTQGILDLPPINGCVGLQLADDQTSISVTTTIEKIEVDAAALQGIIGVVNQPEVESVISAIKSGVEDVQAQIAELYPADAEIRRQKKTTHHETAFDIRFALLGVRVAAVTPGNLGRSTAEIEFGIGPVHATASNRGPDMRAKSLIPEVRAHIQDIGASLRIHERGKTRHCGHATFSMGLHLTSKTGEHGLLTRELNVRSNALDINAYPETASTIVDVINHLQDRIKHLDLSKEVEYLRRLRDKRKGTVMRKIKKDQGLAETRDLPFCPEELLSIKTNVQLNDIQVCWLIDPSFAPRPQSRVDDLIFSIESVQFSTRGVNEARLTIRDMQLQFAKKEFSKQQRALNSALLPEMNFSVAYWTEDKNRSLAFKASGKPLDLRLESKFMFPLTAAQRSIELAVERFKKGTATWQGTPTSTGAPRAPIFDVKRVTSLLVEADFAGAQVYMQGAARENNIPTLAAAASQRHSATHGRYGQFAAEGAVMHTTLTAPGIAFKMEYNLNEHRPTVHGELMIDASSNMLLPNVVPLVLEVTNSVKEVMQSAKQTNEAPVEKPLTPPDNTVTQNLFEEESIANANPARFFGKTKVDLGFRICKQEFGLTCQPIARVDAKASLDDFYMTMNTIDSDEHGHFFAMSAVVTKLKTEVQHMYSKEPTFSFDMDSVVLSAMNNKHLSGTPGVSAILNVNPTCIVINGKQVQDLLLFREIWMPPEIRDAAAAASASASASTSSTSAGTAASQTKAEDFFVQRYQSVASSAAFPWNATVSITKLAVDLDLGQSIGKSSFTISDLWASQQKSSNWEQTLCIGVGEMAVNSTGRMSGFIQLAKLGIRTSIKWPEDGAEDAARTTPLIQASIGSQKLKAKAAFDYQPFAFADIESFDFLMYNVHDGLGSADRLVAVLDCERAYVFCTPNSPAQAVGLYQAFDRLILEKQAAHVQSLRDIEKHIRRESTVVSTRFGPPIQDSSSVLSKPKKTSITLHTDVVVTMGNICFGIYPGTFFDSQMLKVEASNIQARFAVGVGSGKLNSGLGMTLGQLQVALSSTRKVSAVPKALDVSVEDVITNALNAKGGTILRVPKVVASMQTWQADSNNVDYIFKSLFDGKIDVGWNLSRINFIKGMWTTHSRALASRLGKSLPQSAVKITAGPQTEDDLQGGDNTEQQQEKITAEINLPQSRYEYHALEPPIIETPQLRDLGEATPSLHWIGLDKDRLPNFTHQIVIVSLLEVCKEVQDAYEKILGTSQS